MFTVQSRNGVAHFFTFDYAVKFAYKAAIVWGHADVYEAKSWRASFCVMRPY